MTEDNAHPLVKRDGNDVLVVPPIPPPWFRDGGAALTTAIDDPDSGMASLQDSRNE